MASSSEPIKGPVAADVKYDGSGLRIAIVHSRWNKYVVDSLVAGAVAKLKESGVREQNIVIQSVPGAFELPLSCAKYVDLIRVFIMCFSSWSGSSLVRMLKLVFRQPISWEG